MLASTSARRVRCVRPHIYRARYSTAPKPPVAEPTVNPTTPERTWLSKLVTTNPNARKAFTALTSLTGLNSKRAYAGRRSKFLYRGLCESRPEEERQFWQEECHLPPTFQSWFTITNLHVWLLTVRLRALPEPHGRNLIQGLLDHFFLNVEDRVRAVLQPASFRYPTERTAEHTDPSPTLPPFYIIANSGNTDRPKGNAPERLVTRHMKVMREQWNGMNISFDLSLVNGDAEMAAAVWRNFLGARGARGIVYPNPENQQYFRRSINVVEDPSSINPEARTKEETTDDGSGIHDFTPSEAGKYVKYPELMEDIVGYIRRELGRLEKISDEEIIGRGEIGTEAHDIQPLRFGPVITR